MKKVFFMFTFLFCLTLSFAHTPAETVCNDEAVSVGVDETVTVSMDELFGTGRFYGCYIAQSSGVVVTYQLIPQNGGTTISGTIDCNSDLVTLTPFVEYDLFITTNDKIWLFLQWEFCNVPGGNPGVSLTTGTHNLGSIFITC